MKKFLIITVGLIIFYCAIMLVYGMVDIGFTEQTRPITPLTPNQIKNSEQITKLKQEIQKIDNDIESWELTYSIDKMAVENYQDNSNTSFALGRPSGYSYSDRNSYTLAKERLPAEKNIIRKLKQEKEEVNKKLSELY
jgi:hypothetical protein